jgi:hypothetical protein
MDLEHGHGPKLKNSPGICLVELKGTGHSQVNRQTCWSVNAPKLHMGHILQGRGLYIHTECSESRSGVSAAYIFLEIVGTTY